MARLLSRVEFAALLAYSPYGKTDYCRRMRHARDGVKFGDQDIYRRAAEVTRELVEAGVLGPFFGPEVSLVPVPRSAPLYPGALWPAREIAAALLAEGLGAEVLSCLERRVAVPMSHVASAGQRTSVQRHLETMVVQRPLQRPTKVTLVDDVVARGRTLFASCCLVAEALSDTAVRAFAVLRTIGWGQPVDVDTIPDARTGTLTWNGTDVDREP